MGMSSKERRRTLEEVLVDKAFVLLRYNHDENLIVGGEGSRKRLSGYRIGLELPLRCV
jgi:hypothetical protein